MTEGISHQVGEVDLEAMMRAVVRKVSVYNPRADHDHLWQAFRFGKEAHEGQLRKSGEHLIPEGVVYDDALTAFYNLRYGVYGSVDGAKAFTIKTLPTDAGKDIDIKVRFASKKEFGERVGISDSRQAYLADARLDKELFDSDSGDMEIVFSPEMLVTSAVAKDVLFFGDVRGKLLLPSTSR